ncbi:MAG: SLC13 family permease [Pseudomonadota bacterium]
MTQDQTILFALFAAVFGLLLWGRVRYDIVAFGALMTGVVAGVVPSSDAFSGFGHPATLVVALVLIVSAGLVRSGAVYLITRTMIDAARPLGAHIAIMGSVGGVLSAFMNNVAALALFMPIDIQTARKAGRAPGLSLMPLSFATILGGMVTLIGTPSNIIIATIREDILGSPFAMFDFAPVGGITALVGLAFVALVGWRLIPGGDGVQAASAMDDIAAYVAELTIPDGSKQVGRRLADLYDAAEAADVAILGLVRGGKRLYGTQRNATLAAGDAIVIEARPDALDEFRSALALDFADKGREAKLRSENDGLAVTEVVVPQGARIAGRTAQAVGLSWRKRTVLLGISRRGRRITSQVRKTPIKAGDILLLLTPERDAGDVTEWLGALPLAERGLAVTDNSKVWLAIGLFAAAVGAAAAGLVYLPVALGIVVVAYTLLRVLPLAEIYDHVEWPVVVLLGSMIPLGAALETTGGTDLIAGGLVSLSAGLPAWAVMTLLLVVTMTLSDILNNTATAIVAAPVAIEMATRLGVNPDAFLMAVAIGAACAFLTPIGHKNNTLILGPGGYRFGDYWRMGLPLEILVIIVSVPAILLVWGL